VERYSDDTASDTLWPEKQSDKGDKSDQSDKSLGDDTVEAPDLEDVGFDVTEVKGEGESGDSKKESEPAAAEEGGEGDGGVSKNAGERDGKAGPGCGAVVDVGIAGFAEVEEDAVEGGVGASVDPAAVPVGIDVAGLDTGGVVDVEGEGGDQDAGEGEDDDQVSHGWLGSV
jgi:hypothetical protein